MAALIILLAISCIFVLPFYWIYRPPNLLIRYFQVRWPAVLWHVSTTSKIVALTIDDGPSQHTKEIMEILKANDVKATFFIIGSQVAGRENILEDLVRNGHELGNHAMHDEASRSLSTQTLTEHMEAVTKMNDNAYKAVGDEVPPMLFRPGNGFFSERILKVCKKLGYRLVLGSIYPHDAQVSYWRLNAWHILSMLRPGGIIICHDRRSWTVPMLKTVLPAMKRRGYQVVTISELLKTTSA